MSLPDLSDPKPGWSRWWSTKKLLGAVFTLVFVVVVGGIFANWTNFFAAKITKTDVAVGDCITRNKDTHVVTRVACDQSDLGKVYAVPVLPKGDYPGAAQLDKTAQQTCLSASGKPTEPGIIGWAPPEETSWKQGQHDVFCFNKSLKVGDCLGEDEHKKVRPAACGQGDLGKIYAIPVLPAGTFPGAAQVEKATEQACQTAGSKLPEGTPIRYVPPSETYWNAGHREAFCTST